MRAGIEWRRSRLPASRDFIRHQVTRILAGRDADAAYRDVIGGAVERYAMDDEHAARIADHALYERDPAMARYRITPAEIRAIAMETRSPSAVPLSCSLCDSTGVVVRGLIHWRDHGYHVRVVRDEDEAILAAQTMLPDTGALGLTGANLCACRRPSAS